MKIQELLKTVQENTQITECLNCIFSHDGNFKRRPFKYEMRVLTTLLKKEGFNLEEITAKASELGVLEFGGPFIEGWKRGCLSTKGLEQVLIVLEREGKRRSK